MTIKSSTDADTVAVRKAVNGMIARLTAGDHYYISGENVLAGVFDATAAFEAASVSAARRKARKLGAKSLWLFAVEGGCMRIPL